MPRDNRHPEGLRKVPKKDREPLEVLRVVDDGAAQRVVDVNALNWDIKDLGAIQKLEQAFRTEGVVFPKLVLQGSALAEALQSAFAEIKPGSPIGNVILLPDKKELESIGKVVRKRVVSFANTSDIPTVDDEKRLVEYLERNNRALAELPNDTNRVRLARERITENARIGRLNTVEDLRREGTRE